MCPPIVIFHVLALFYFPFIFTPAFILYLLYSTVTTQTTFF